MDETPRHPLVEAMTPVVAITIAELVVSGLFMLGLPSRLFHSIEAIQYVHLVWPALALARAVFLLPAWSSERVGPFLRWTIPVDIALAALSAWSTVTHDFHALGEYGHYLTSFLATSADASLLWATGLLLPPVRRNLVFTAIGARLAVLAAALVGVGPISILIGLASTGLALGTYLALKKDGAGTTSSTTATTTATTAATGTAPAPARSAGASLAFGLALLAIGGFITALSYSSASGGGRYVVTTGLFVVGGINVLRGLFGKLTA